MPAGQPAAVVEHADEERRRLVGPVLGVEQLGRCCRRTRRRPSARRAAAARGSVAREEEVDAERSRRVAGGVDDAAVASSRSSSRRGRARLIDAPSGRAAPVRAPRRPAQPVVRVADVVSVVDDAPLGKVPAPARPGGAGSVATRAPVAQRFRRNSQIRGDRCVSEHRGARRASAAGVRIPHQNRSRPSTSTTRAAGPPRRTSARWRSRNGYGSLGNTTRSGASAGHRVEVGLGVAVGARRANGFVQPRWASTDAP